MDDFCMPSLGADMEAGTLLEWLVKPGDRVKRGDIVVVVETLKGAVEVEIFSDGVIDSLLVAPGSEVPVGTVLARVRTSSDSPGGEQAEPLAAALPEAPAPAQQSAEAPAALAEAPAALAEAPAGAASLTPPADASMARLRVSPAARKRAAELGLALAGLPGSGPDGAITLADVEAAATRADKLSRPEPETRAAAESEPETPAAAESEPEPRAVAESEPEPRAVAESESETGLGGPSLGSTSLSGAGMRTAIAAAMSRSKREIPHYYLAHSVDLTPALDWLAAANASRPLCERLVYAVLLIKAVALALRKFPEFNGFWRESGFEASAAIDVGMAISLRSGGLVAPALRQADQKDLTELMADLRDLVGRTRSTQLRASEFSGGTITLTSLGEQGVESVFPVIYPPQVAMIGFGSILARPWVVAGEIVPRQVIQVSLAADHRVSDGHRGALLLARIASLLQNPEAL